MTCSKFGCLLIAVGLLSLTQKIATAEQHQTNVILITVDTLRADRLQAYGYEKGRTPATSRLAGDSVLFENVRVQMPITLPSHTSILTGTYPFYHGVQNSVGYLREGVPTLGEWFRGHGYKTGAILGSVVLLAQWGLNRGFDVYDDNFPFSSIPRSSPPDKPLLTDQLVSQIERPAERVVDLALTWLYENRKSPFFLWVHFYDPHDPYEPPEPFRRDFEERLYDGEIAYLEMELARFFNQLRDWDLYDSSLIVYTADHGESLGEHKEKYHAYYLYDASLRVPLMFKVPDALSEGRISRGTRIADQVRSVDIAPTVIQLLGERVPDYMQGEGLVAVMTGRRTGTQLPAYAETHYPRHFGWSSLFSYSTPTHKYIDAPIPELYDLRIDPAELANIFPEQSALANQLRNGMYDLQRKFAPLSGAGEAGSLEADSETIERLQSLGYVAFSSGKRETSLDSRLPDPKLKIDSYSSVNQALEVARQGNSEGAIRIIQGVLQQEPEAPLVHFLLASEFFRARLFLKAAEHFTEAARLEPQSHAARFNLARSYFHAGLSSRAEHAVRELLSLEPAYFAGRHLLANLLAKRGEYRKAVEEELVVLQTRPYYLPALNNLGSYYLEMGDLTSAIQIYLRGIDVAPDLALLRDNLSLAYLRQREFQKALEQSELSIKMAPRNGYAHYYMGQAYKGMGNQEKAKRAFDKAGELDPKLVVPTSER